MKSDVWIGSQPVAHVQSEVRAEVVYDGVNLAIGVLGSDRLHKREKFF
jgi:hypothetical protein